MLLSGYQIGQRTDIFIAAKKKKKILLDINALDQGLVNCSLWTKPNLKPVLVNKDLWEQSFSPALTYILIFILQQQTQVMITEHRPKA